MLSFPDSNSYFQLEGIFKYLFKYYSTYVTEPKIKLMDLYALNRKKIIKIKEDIHKNHLLS